MGSRGIMNTIEEERDLKRQEMFVIKMELVFDENVQSPEEDK